MHCINIPLSYHLHSHSRCTSPPSLPPSYTNPASFRVLSLALSLSGLLPCTLDHPLLHVPSFNKYISIAARATRQALKEEERLAADKRNPVTLKWQTWKDGKGSAQVSALCFLSLAFFFR